MSTIPPNQELLKHLFALLQAHRGSFKQERTYQRVVALVLAELFVFARHTITQLLMSLGQTEQDWSSWYRVLYHLPPPPPPNQRGRKRVYGERAATPQQVWQQTRGWHKRTLQVRGRPRHLQVKVRGVFIRKGAAHCPLFLIVVRGKDNARTRREPLPFLVNAQQADNGSWRLPLPLDTLLFWAWQRWELEVCHRELKSNFGLGNKQCFNPHAAVASVQWSAWVYALLLLAGYRTFGLTHATTVPTRWWRGSPRWSLNTLWRAYRAAFWQQHEFHPICSPTPPDWAEKEVLLLALRNAVFAAARS